MQLHIVLVIFQFPRHFILYTKIIMAASIFSLRIVSTDHSMIEPIPGLDMTYSEFRRSQIYKVPVIRIFGPTLSGQKTCMCVHGVFPYLYVPYDGPIPAEQYLQQFASSIDKAINIAQGKASSAFHHVYKLSLVSGIPFYGYHNEEQAFLKIYLYNPNLIKKVADLLLAGAVMNRIFQPHESHIPYTLQMFMDYNLFGMNIINVATFKFRQPVPSKLGLNEQSLLLSSLKNSSPDSSVLLRHQIWSSEIISGDMIVGGDVKRSSTCELEVDVVAADILNRLEVSDKIGANPGLVALWEDEKQRRQERNLPSQLAPPDSPERGSITWTLSEHQLQQRLQKIVDSLNEKVSTDGKETGNSIHESNTTLTPEDLDGPPIVCETIISNVVSSSQNFVNEYIINVSQNAESFDDKSFAQMLASLPDASQHSFRSTSPLEDKDSLLSQVVSIPDDHIDEVNRQEALESLEMSSCLDEESDERYLEDMNFDGMNVSWNSSQLKPIDDDISSQPDSDDVVQLDGPIDEKKIRPKVLLHKISKLSHIPSSSSHPENVEISHENRRRSGLRLRGDYKEHSKSVEDQLEKSCVEDLNTSIKKQNSVGRHRLSLNKNASRHSLQAPSKSEIEVECNSKIAADCDEKINQTETGHLANIMLDLQVSLCNVTLYKNGDCRKRKCSNCDLNVDKKSLESSITSDVTVKETVESQVSTLSQMKNSLSLKKRKTLGIARRISTVHKNRENNGDVSEVKKDDGQLLEVFVLSEVDEIGDMTVDVISPRSASLPGSAEVRNMRTEARVELKRLVLPSDTVKLVYSTCDGREKLSFLPLEGSISVNNVEKFERSIEKSANGDCIDDGLTNNAATISNEVTSSSFREDESSSPKNELLIPTDAMSEVTTPNGNMTNRLVSMNSAKNEGILSAELHQCDEILESNVGGVNCQQSSSIFDVNSSQSNFLSMPRLEQDKSLLKTNLHDHVTEFDETESALRPSFCMELPDDDTIDCPAEKLNVLYRFALLSSPETSDIDSSPPLPFSPSSFNNDSVSVCNSPAQTLSESVIDNGENKLQCVADKEMNQVPDSQGNDFEMAEDFHHQNTPSGSFVREDFSEIALNFVDREISGVDPARQWTNLPVLVKCDSITGDGSISEASMASEAASSVDLFSDNSSIRTVVLKDNIAGSSNNMRSFGAISLDAQVLVHEDLTWNDGDRIVDGTSRALLEPFDPPPSRKQVTTDLISTGLTFGSGLVGNAFFSDPKDVPQITNGNAGTDGRLKIQSPLINDLPEFPSLLREQGLIHWQNHLMSKEWSYLGHSQTSASDLVKQTAERRSLSTMLTGDRKVVILPHQMPPTQDSVTRWLCQRRARKQLKEKSEAQETENKSLPREKSNVALEVADRNQGNEQPREIISTDQSAKSQSSIEIRDCSDNKDKLNETLPTPHLLSGSKSFVGMARASSIELEIPNNTHREIILKPSVDEGDPIGDEMINNSNSMTTSMNLTFDLDELLQEKRPDRLVESGESCIPGGQAVRSSDVPSSGIQLKGSNGYPLTFSPKLLTSNDNYFHSDEVKCIESSLLDGQVEGVNETLSQEIKKSEDESLLTGSQSKVVKSQEQQKHSSDLSLACSQKPSSNTILTPGNRAPELDLLGLLGSQIKEFNHDDIIVASTPSHNSLKKQTAAFKDKSLECTPICRENGLENFSDNVRIKNGRTDVKNSTPTSIKINGNSMRNGGSDVARNLLAAENYSKADISLEFSTTNNSVSQIDGPTLKNTFGFKVGSQNLQQVKGVHECQYLTVISLELHISCRSDSNPDPEFDPISAAIFCIHQDQPFDDATHPGSSPHSVGVVLFEGDGQLGVSFDKTGLPDVTVVYVKTEQELLSYLVNMVKNLDADILVGYEVQKLSWGYLVQRATHLNILLLPQFSRLPGQASRQNQHVADSDEYGPDISSEIHIPGRIVLNLWRLIRHEVSLNIYTFENVAYHVLHQRFPHYSFRCLTEWFNHKSHLFRWRTIEYYIIRSKGNQQLMEQLDLIGQTSEFARVFGIEFYEVLSRGSQYRVESMMLRIAKPLNYIAVSPGVQQRSRMRSPECIPLTLEPKSDFYTHPVVVLDFQSLYPSIMIAYNYCFSTCLGRIEHFSKLSEGPFEFGCTSLNVPPDLLKMLADDVTICPNGVVFVKQHIRKGVVSRMVEEILNTRLMVKKAMKEHKNDKGLQRLLHARQLGLKLIANVTFGYTAANFSGRMPCVEVGDSILRKSRETLERAIQLVEATPKWGAKVMYGDTDSMFVLLKDRTKDEAFVIGQEIADAVTASNPKPIKLKLEKVYLPCILQTKKRYVGFMYETPDQKEPTFDAKGIETVRRDNCAVVGKILERSIKILFTTSDVSLVKRYVQRQCIKLIEGRASFQDCIFAKEYRGMAGYQPGACVPALEIARRTLAKDRRSEPLRGERVPYVIIYGSPGLPLIQLVRQPHEVLNDPRYRINSTYYITKQILPPLGRIFMLLGLDVMTWYQELPRVLKSVPIWETVTDGKKGTISQYFSSLNCPVCEEVTNSGLCLPCKTDKQRTAVVLGCRISSAERNHSQMELICTACMGCIDPHLPCNSLDCPVFFRLMRATRELANVVHLRKLQERMLQF